MFTKFAIIASLEILFLELYVNKLFSFFYIEITLRVLEMFFEVSNPHLHITDKKCKY